MHHRGVTAVLPAVEGDLLQRLEERTRDLPPDEKVAVYEEVRRRLRAMTRGSRYETVLDLLKVIRPGYTVTAPLRRIAEELVGVAEGRVRRLAVFMPPQEGKSETITIGGPLWMLMRNPDQRLGIASYEVNVATRFGRAVRDEVVSRGSGTRLAPRRPEDDALSLSIREGDSAASRWRVSEGAGGLVSVGIGGALTSRPIDGLFIDDPIKDRVAAESPVYRQRAWDWWTSVALTRLPPGGFVVLVMTRWHEDDLAGRLIDQERNLAPEQRTWRFVSIPAVAEPPDPEGRRLPDALGRPVGVFIDSARGRTEDDFRATRLAVGERDWSALYQQNPTPTTGGVFSWLPITRNRRSPDDLPAISAGFVRRLVSVDPPGGAGTRDEAGIIAGARHEDGRVYITRDASGAYTASRWPRVAMLTVLETDADELIFEYGLAGPTMSTILRDAWQAIAKQARTLDRHLRGGNERVYRNPQEPLSRAVLDDVETPAAASRTAAIREAALELAASASGRPPEEVDTPALEQALADLAEVEPLLARVLALPDTGPRVRPVHAAGKGKRLRAVPIAGVYEANRVSHVGVFPEFEQQLTSWTEGEDSPDRMDAGVYLVGDLSAVRRAGIETPQAGSIPTGADAFRGR